MRLSGLKTLVTGARGDIGRAIATAFLREGADVLCVDIDAEGAAASAGLARQAAGKGRAVGHATDISDPDQATAAIAAAVGTFGRLDVLVNNAAVISPRGTAEELPVEDWKAALDVNVTGTMLMCRAAIPAMRTTGGGAIINVASQLGQTARAGQLAYGTSKAAILFMSRIMALDHAAEGIRINTLSPGAVLTSRLIDRYGSAEAVTDLLAPRHPVGRIGRPEEVADAAVYLASPEAVFMTGADLRIDGGFAA